MTFDYRGHGRAGGRRGHCNRFDEFLGDLDRAIAHAAKELPGQPIAIVAHSHGALISLRALTDPSREPKVCCAVLSSPFLGLALKVSPVKVLAGKIASRIAPTLTLKSEIDAEKISHDPAMIAARRTDTLCHGVATARWFTEATAAQDYVAEHASRVRVPTLWLVAGGDEIADPKASRRVYDRLGGDKTIHVYEGYHHEVFNEVGRKEVLSTLVEWLSAKVPSA
jgi:alpha-beta hydrolase superfamily lysophospholipase